MSKRQDHFLRAAGDDDEVLERWLKFELSRQHDQVLDEPVPPEILAILADDKKAVLF